MPIIPKPIYRVNAIPKKILAILLIHINKILKFIWKSKETEIAKAILKKKYSRRNQSTQSQVLLCSYSNQDRVILAERQTHTSVEQNRELRNSPTKLIFDEGAKVIQGRRCPLQQMVLKQVDIHRQRN